MIFQQWVMRACHGRPSVAVKRLEAANGGHPIETGRVYRALRRPLRFPVKFAQLVVTASGGECSLVELMDLEVIRASFEYTNPDLRRRGLEYQIMRAERRRGTQLMQRDRIDAVITALDLELAGYRAQLAEVDDDDAPLTAAG